jgi:peptidoglycan hydrolase-like protein with peptidoglycan-binding domain
MKYALNFETEALGDVAESDEFEEESKNSFRELDEYSDHECESCSEFDPEYDESEWEAEIMRGRRAPQRRAPIRPGMRRPRFRPLVIRRPGKVLAGPSVCTCPAPNCPRHGSEYVRWVQSALNQIMNLRLAVTGVMSSATRSALRSFQEKQGLPVDGIAGPETLEALIGAKGGKSPGGEAAKPAEPGMAEPSEPVATSAGPDTSEPTPPAAEFDFVWETLDDAFEDAGEEVFQTNRLSKRAREFETASPPVSSPKTISRFNTDLNAPYFGGNFNFLYNGGSNEAVITYNTYLSYTKSFSEAQKRQLINNLKRAVAVWDGAAEVQIKDAAGNYHDRIRLRFKLNFVNDPKNANKRTQVHPPGSRTVFFMDKDRENVMRDLNIYIGSSRNVLVHELGHVWGLLDEYKDRWISMKLSLGHVGADSPLIKDKISIMNEGYADEAFNTGEFRTRYFQHFGREILRAFWGMKKYRIPVRVNGKVVANTVQGRIALLKRDIAGNLPYTSNRLPFNPVFTGIQIAKRS